MHAILPVIGVVLILAAPGLAVWRERAQQRHWPTVYGLCLIAGVVLCVLDRVTKVPVPGIGAIETAVGEAQTDAKIISDIKDQVQAQRATIDLVATDAARARVLSEDAERTSRAASVLLHELNAGVKEAQKALLKLQTTRAFTMTVLAAMGDDRGAFDRLQRLSRDPHYHYASQAARAWSAVSEAHAAMLSPGSFEQPPVQWADGVDPARLTLVAIRNAFQREAPEWVRPAIVRYVAQRGDFPKKDRMRFLVEVMETDRSLLVVEVASRAFNWLAGLHYKPLVIEPQFAWWREHENDDVETSPPGTEAATSTRP